MGCPVTIDLVPDILGIDRTQPFNPAAFTRQGEWTIWCGPADGDGLNGPEDQEVRSLALNEIDLAKIRCVTMLEPDEEGITVGERIWRLKKAGHIPLDAKIFQTFWENQDRIPVQWKIAYMFVFFEGTILRSPDGNRHVLVLCFDGARWRWSCALIYGSLRYSDDGSVVLENT